MKEFIGQCRRYPIYVVSRSRTFDQVKRAISQTFKRPVEKVLEMCKSAFFDLVWQQAYSGPAWGKIADSALKFYKIRPSASAEWLLTTPS
jgi:hypothetical protein